MSQRVSQRDQFVRAAMSLFHAQGFRATGIEQVITAVGGSKGSFYHHFKSKDDLGRAVLDRGAEMVVGAMEKSLKNKGVPPVERLLKMIDIVATAQAQAGYRKGSMLGNFVAELGGTHDTVREHLATIFARWTRAIACTLREAQERGELSLDKDPDALAHFVLMSVEGAVLVAKAERDGKAIADCREFLAELLEYEPATAPANEVVAG